MNKLIVITKPDCGGCSLVKNYLDDNEVFYEVIDGFTEVDALIKFAIMSFPVTVLVDEKGFEIGRVNGFQSDYLNELIAKL